MYNLTTNDNNGDSIMVLAIPTTQPGLEGQIGHLENSDFLLIVDLALTDFEELSNPLTASDDSHGEISLVLCLIEADVQIILVDHCESEVPNYLGSAGIQVIEGMQGDALSALEQFREYCLDQTQIMPVIHLTN